MKERIRMLRESLGLTQAKFAESLGIGRSSVAKLESGENNPSSQTIQLICTQFNVNPEWLKDGVDVPMFLPDDDPDDAVLRILNGADPWKKKIILALSHMPPECWDSVRTLAQYYKSLDDKTPEKE